MSESTLPGPVSNLGELSTRWSAIRTPNLFVIRYAAVIRRLLSSLLRNQHDADEVFQDFLLVVTKNGFPQADPGRGRFRDYLFVAVRNAALRYQTRKLTRQKREAQVVPASAMMVAESWEGDWRGCFLERAMNALYHHQRRTPGNLAHTVLQLRIDFPEADSVFLAAEASRRCGRAIRPDGYRQHLHRARVLLARLLIEEVVQTLEDPTPREVSGELIGLGLMHYVAPFLPSDWLESGALPLADDPQVRSSAIAPSQKFTASRPKVETDDGS
jgi:DNA-directed RNA polymerase specialized sigma24 family protein